MSNSDNNQISRRRFITAVGAASIVSGAAGARLASRQNQSGPAIISVSPEPEFNDAQFDRPTAEPVITNPAELTQAQDQVTRLTAENNQLMADYSALQQEMETLKASLSGQTDQVTELETQLASAVKGRSAALGLVALYEQLEDIDISETFQSGISAVGDAWDEFIDDLPDTSVRLEEIKAVVTDFDSQIPSFQTARAWLSTRLELMQRDNNLLQEVLQAISEPAGSLLEMLGRWFDEVRSWLPARFLETANNVIESILSLMAGLPVTIDGTQSNVVAALDGWFADDDDPDNASPESPIIRKRLFSPLANETLPQTISMLQKTRIAKQKYEANLVSQVTDKIQKRQAVEQLISEFRERNELQRTEL